LLANSLPPVKTGVCSTKPASAGLPYQAVNEFTAEFASKILLSGYGGGRLASHRTAMWIEMLEQNHCTQNSHHAPTGTDKA
jgi:hypothetical protein